MGNTTSLVLPPPSQLTHVASDLIVGSADGQRNWQLRRYFCGLGDAAINARLAALHHTIVLERHPEVGGELWALGGAGDDLIIGDDRALNVTANAGDDIILTGAHDDYLDGVDGNDWLDGGAGDDELMGGAGDDRLQGRSGNDGLQGGDGNDSLYGGTGNDQLLGGPGNDRLIGGPGNDIYTFERGDGRDRIVDRGRADDRDIVQFCGDITSDELWFARSGQDLQVSLVGTQDVVTLVGWYADDAHRADRFELCHTVRYGCAYQYLDRNGVEALVQAMSAFAPPPAGSTSLPDDYRSTLDPVLSTHWKTTGAN